MSFGLRALNVNINIWILGLTHEILSNIKYTACLACHHFTNTCKMCWSFEG